NDFSFKTANDIEPFAQVTSNTIFVSGLSTTVPISVTDGFYSLNGGAFTNAAGTINNGDAVRVQRNSGDYNDTVSVILDINGVVGNFDITSKADNDPNTFSFVSATDLELFEVVESNPVIITGIANGTVISVEGGEYQLDGNGYTDLAGVINA